MSHTIAIVTDAWSPQVNGVVTTLKNLISELEARGYTVTTVTPQDASWSIATLYTDVSICKIPDQVLEDKLLVIAEHVHIATPEGSVGRAAVKYCSKHGIEFTTGYHTNWPEFMSKMFRIPRRLTRFIVKRVHRGSNTILTPTQGIANEIADFGNVKVWTRGVDRTVFTYNDTPSDYIVCVSRVSKEKNLEAFFKLPKELGRKIMVGDGPMLEEYKEKYKDVVFVGSKNGKELAEYYRNAQVFVFPSKADTFGLVMIEAMACGTPVAAYPVNGPIDVIENRVTGYMARNLHHAVLMAGDLDRKQVHKHGMKWTWEECANQFLSSCSLD